VQVVPLQVPEVAHRGSKRQTKLAVVARGRRIDALRDPARQLAAPSCRNCSSGMDRLMIAQAGASVIAAAMVAGSGMAAMFCVCSIRASPILCSGANVRWAEARVHLARAIDPGAF
jgi:hypothetical protein